MWIATIHLQTACLLLAFRLTGYTSPYEALWSAEIGWYSTPTISEFQLCPIDLLLMHGYFWFFPLINTVYASRISALLTLLILLR